jgi:hypothetical protein
LLVSGQGLAELAAALQKALGVQPSREQLAVAEWEEMEAQLQGATGQGAAHESVASSSSTSSSSTSSSSVLAAVSTAFAAAAGDMGLTQKQSSEVSAGDQDDVDDDFEDDYEVLGHGEDHPAGHKAWGSVDEEDLEGEEEQEEWTAAEEAELQALLAADMELGEGADGEEGAAGEGQEEEEEEEEQPPPLDPNDPDAWLFALSEEELLKLEQEQ